jgi:anti-sigma B factor antagonist
MSDMEITERRVNDVQILELSGRFDISTANSVLEWIETLTGKPPARVVVNMAKVNFVDSTGLSTLVQGTKQSRMQNGDLYICGLQQPVRIIFELTRLDKYFEIFSAEEEAIAAFTLS